MRCFSEAKINGFVWLQLVDKQSISVPKKAARSFQTKKKIKVIHSENVKTGCFDTVGVYFQISFERYFDSMDQVAGSAGILEEEPHALTGQGSHTALPVAAPKSPSSPH